MWTGSHKQYRQPETTNQLSTWFVFSLAFTFYLFLVSISDFNSKSTNCMLRLAFPVPLALMSINNIFSCGFKLILFLLRSTGDSRVIQFNTHSFHITTSLFFGNLTFVVLSLKEFPSTFKTKEDFLYCPLKRINLHFFLIQNTEKSFTCNCNDFPQSTEILLRFSPPKRHKF